MELLDKKIMVTGGAGFVGAHVIDELRELGCENIFAPRSIEYNLLVRSDIDRLFERFRPDIVIHLAAKVGGIVDINNNPGTYYYENLVMGTELLEKCRNYNIEKFVAIGTSCSYPEKAIVPFVETSLFDGYPQKTNASYGLAKRALYQQCLSYQEQYGLDFIYLIPTNAYGERDCFKESSSHVIPGLIRKFLSAYEKGEREVVLWGSGKPTREFMYIKDVAKAIVKATLSYEENTPLNIGTGVETSIQELATQIADIVGYAGEIKWDTTKPDGYLRKCLSNEKMKKKIHLNNFTKVKDGLEKTIEWARSNIQYTEGV